MTTGGGVNAEAAPAKDTPTAERPLSAGVPAPPSLLSGAAVEGEAAAAPARPDTTRRYWLTDEGEAALRGVADPTAPLVITVYDTPAPQGSKKGFVVGNRAVVVDDNKPKLRTWREAVKQAALDALALAPPDKQGMAERLGFPFGIGPIGIEVTFTLTKPASAPKTRVTWPKGRPDVDKLVRSTFDALTAAGVWKDDAQVVELTARKVYPDEGIDALRQPGALIRVWRVTA